MPAARSTPAAQGGHGKLTPGSRLPPEVVRESQRERLMAALVEVVDRQGLPASTVADLLARAHVSRAAFYEQFGDLEDCFLATVDTHGARVGAQVLSAYNTPDLDWPERVRRGAGALERAIEAWPAAARVVLADLLTAGAAADARHQQTLALVGRLLRDARVAAGERASASKRAALVATGALRGLLRERLREPRGAEESAGARPALGDELAGWLLACLPFPPVPARALPTGGGASRARCDSRSPSDHPAPDPSAPDPSAPDQPASAESRSEERRERIVQAVAELAAEKGYRAMSHRDIASRAKVSYNTFYNHFESKREAMLAACERARRRLTAPIAPALSASIDGPTRVCVAIDAFLRSAAASPRELRLLGMEAYAVGHPGLEQLDLLAGELAGILAPVHAGPPSTAGHAFGGAVLELLRHHATTGRPGELIQAGPELAYVALAPVLGREAALEACHLGPHASSSDTWPGREAGGLTAGSGISRSRSSGSASGC